ncbi:MAG TPA: agmatine deiminase family protein [Alphaproteobacteria bacterium]|jgi:agmatine deiminase|nr:agmatine deiminase family protein [Alphaproteobacteria bacterium]
MTTTTKTPASLGFALPAEWTKHARTWLAWPQRPATWQGEGIEAARRVHVELAKALAEFEPVTIVCNPSEMAEASLMCGPGIDLTPVPVSDGWMRDIGPTFVTNAAGEIAGIDWIFNGWGGLHGDFALDAKVAEEVTKLRGCPRFPAPIVLEGGAIVGDGEGTLLVTEECLLDPGRNPGKTKGELEAVLADCLGARRVIWLGRGYEGDETHGHIDEIACFAKPGTVMIQMPADAADPNYLVQHDNLARLKSARDAAGRELEIVEIPQPYRREMGGTRLTLSYINFVFANGGLIMPSFGDAADDPAFRIFSGLFPDRKIIQLQADDLVVGGGGLHCITQQEPAA